MSNLSKITVAVLAGGLGTRLQPVTKKQKVIAEVNSQPFLKYLLDHLNTAGFKNIVLCTGYLGEQVEESLGKKHKDLNLLYSREKSPLGTAGALRLALPFINSETVLVMNGDTFCNVDLKKFVEFHFDKKANASLVISSIEDTARYGSVKLDFDDVIVGFVEKMLDGGSGWINGGVYLINRPEILKIPENKEISFENEIFPTLIGKNFYGYKNQGYFIDIGTPQSYSQAVLFFEKLKQKQKRFVLLDRDGTMIIEKNYLSNPDHLVLLPGVVKALKEFKKMSLGLIVITNQSGVGRGYFDLKTLEKIHQRLNRLLASNDIFLDDIYFCPHIPEDNCLCRKPNAELVEKAMKKYDFDPKLSFVVGDNRTDIELGKKIGATTILVRTGHGAKVEKANLIKPDYIVDDLRKASNIVRTLI